MTLANGERGIMCQPIVAEFPDANQSDIGFSTLDAHMRARALYLLPNHTWANNGNYYFMADADPPLLPPQYQLQTDSSYFFVMHLENNRPCNVGLCRGGVCARSTARRVSRLWPLYLSYSSWSKSSYLSVAF